MAADTTTEQDGPLAALRRELVRQGIDLAIVGPTGHMRHLLGLRATPVAMERLVALLVSRDRHALILPGFDVEEFAEGVGRDAAFGWDDAHGPAQAVADAIAALELPSAPRVVVDDDLAIGFLRPMLAHLGPDLPGPGGTLLSRLRVPKRAWELDRLAAAGELVSKGMDATLAAARPGMTEVGLVRECERILTELGADAVEIVLVQAGPSSAAPHHFADDTPLRAGQSVLVDIVAGVDGYWGDITANVFLGEPTREYREHYAVVQAAQEAGVVAACAGATTGEVDAAATQVIVEAGLGEWNGPRTGHGIGIDPHEFPSVVAGGGEVLPEGAVISVEPGIYIPGRYGIRIEDLVVVTPDGGRRITRGARPLTVRAERID